MNRLAEDIKKVRSVLSKPENWTQGEAARDDFGTAVAPDSPYAACFCMIGAVRRVFPMGGELDARGVGVLDAIKDTLVREPSASPFIADFNDTPGRKHEEVLAILDKAIEFAGKEV